MEQQALAQVLNPCPVTVRPMSETAQHLGYPLGTILVAGRTLVEQEVPTEAAVVVAVVAMVLAAVEAVQERGRRTADGKGICSMAAYWRYISWRRAFFWS